MTTIYEWALVVTTVAEAGRWVTAATSLPPSLSYAPLARQTGCAITEHTRVYGVNQRSLEKCNH